MENIINVIISILTMMAVLAVLVGSMVLTVYLFSVVTEYSAVTCLMGGTITWAGVFMLIKKGMCWYLGRM